MNAIVEAFAFFLGFIGWLMVGVALPNRYWKVSTVDGNVITTSTIYENLWMSCATDSTGVHNCRDFPSLLALNGTWPARRGCFDWFWMMRCGILHLLGALFSYQELLTWLNHELALNNRFELFTLKKKKNKKTI